MIKDITKDITQALCLGAILCGGLWAVAEVIELVCSSWAFWPVAGLALIGGFRAADKVGLFD